MRKSEPPNLAHHLELCAWLDTATEGLCEAAKQRVEAEIRAHYAETVANELAQGREEEDAYRLALNALGDARKARKMFRRTYLTEKQAALFADVVRSRQRWSQSSRFMFPRCPWLPSALMKCTLVALSIFTFGHLIWDAVVSGFSEDRCWLLAFWTSLTLFWFVTVWLYPWLERRRQWRGLMLCVIFAAALGSTMGGFVFLSDAAKPEGGPYAFWFLLFDVALTVLLLIGMLWVAFRVGSVLRKLGKDAGMYDSLMEGDGDDEGGRYA